MTQHERIWKKKQIEGLLYLIEQSNKKMFSYLDGYMTEEEYAPIKAKRKAWRDEVGRLTKELEGNCNE